MKDKKRFIINCIYYLLLLLAIVICTYVIFNWLLPFIFSLVIVMALQPIIKNIQKMIKIKNKLMTVVITIIIYLIIISLVLYLVFLGLMQLYFLLHNSPSYIDYVYKLVENNEIFVSVNKYIDTLYISVNEIISSFSTSFINFIISLIASIPSLMFDLVFVIISSLFFIIDYDNIKNMFLRRFKNNQAYVVAIIGCAKDTISSLFKAYLIIFLITFIELYIGFLIIGVKDALMIAFGIALFDFFPILGMEMILTPWIAILALTNKIPLALGVLIVYGVVVVTKNIVEPRLISKHLGMHPLITIVSMFVGAKIFGVLGIMIMPVTIMIAKRIYELDKSQFK